MNIITQEAKKRQAVVKTAIRKGKSEASRIYGVSLSSVKRWCKRYDGTWQSLADAIVLANTFSPVSLRLNTMSTGAIMNII